MLRPLIAMRPRRGALGELLERGSPYTASRPAWARSVRARCRPISAASSSSVCCAATRPAAGRLLSRELVRAAMVVRANQLGAGGAGVSDALLEALVTALNEDLIPRAHGIGSLGTGDLTVLAEIALGTHRPLLPEPRPSRRNRVHEQQCERRSGTPRSSPPRRAPTRRRAGRGRARPSWPRRPTRSCSTLACTRRGPMRGRRGRRMDARAARRGRSGEPPREPPAPAWSHGRIRRSRIPTRSARCLRWRGPRGTPLDALERVLAVELNAAAENALIDPVEPAVLPNANFHAGALALALDGFRAALAQSSRSARRA